MNFFFSMFILTLFFFSLRLIDKMRYKKLKDFITKEEEEKLRNIGFFN